MLRRPVRSDAPAIFHTFASDPEVTRYLSWAPHQTLEDAHAAMEGRLARLEDSSELSWIVSSAEGGDVMGAISIWPQGHQRELGFGLGRASWGQGFMTEGGRAILEWAFSVDEVHRVWAGCDVENVASVRVLERIGMQREGLLRRFGIHPNVSDQPRDCYMYSRVRGAG